MTKCQSCEQEKDVTDIEGNLLCKECAKDIVRCDFCNRFLAIDFDELEMDNYGTLGVPELSLPDKHAHLVFCNIDCLEGYIQKYKKELKERDTTCGC
jgi:hypothetical protein